MASENNNGSVLGSGTRYKVVVGVSANANVVLPVFTKGGTPADGTLAAAHGDGVPRQVQVSRILCAAAGVVALYDANSDSALPQPLWTKTVAVGDIYVTDVECLLGAYITTDASAKVTLCCA